MYRHLTKKQKFAALAVLLLAAYMLAILIRTGAVTRQNRQGYILGLMGYLEVTAYNLASVQAGGEMPHGAIENAAKTAELLDNGAEMTRYVSWSLREEPFAQSRTGGMQNTLWRLVYEFPGIKSLTAGQAAYLQEVARAMEQFCTAFPAKDGRIPPGCLTPDYYVRQLIAFEEQVAAAESD